MGRVCIGETFDLDSIVAFRFFFVAELLNMKMKEWLVFVVGVHECVFGLQTLLHSQCMLSLVGK